MLSLTTGRSNLKPSAKEFNKLSIPSEEGFELIPFDQIVQCKAERAYCCFHLKDGKKLLVSKPMKEFEEILLEKGFFKVHKSTIVNISFAEKYVRGKGGYLVLSNGSNVVVSSRKKEELNETTKALRCYKSIYFLYYSAPWVDQMVLSEIATFSILISGLFLYRNLIVIKNSI